MTPLPLSTNLFTLLSDHGLVRLNTRPSRTVAAIFILDQCAKEFKSVKPTCDHDNVVAKLKILEQEGLDAVSKAKFCKFPMKHTDGLFEIRKNGVRLYGCRIASISNNIEIVALLGAEQKAGEREADKYLLDRCQKKESELKVAWNQAVQGCQPNNDIERARQTRLMKHRRN